MNFNLQQMQSELIRDEGTQYRAYKDSLGNWTIGVGHLLGSGDWGGTVWTGDKISSVLVTDITNAYNRIADKDFYLAMDTDARRRALVNMSFQLGDHIFEFVHSLAFLKDHQWSQATDHLRESLWYSQTPARAERVIQQFLKG